MFWWSSKAMQAFKRGYGGELEVGHLKQLSDADFDEVEKANKVLGW